MSATSILLAEKERLAMTYRGHIENGLVVLDETVALPEGTQVCVQPVVEARMSLAERFKGVIGCISDLPSVSHSS
jgi:hypothetical protein